MSQTPDNHEDPRLAAMLDVIFKFAAGDLTARGRLSGKDDALDGVMAGVNILGEELEAYVAENRQTHDALTQALEYANTLIRSSPDGVLAVDLDLRITEWNLLMGQMCGKGREQAIGLNLDDIPFMQKTGEAARIREGLGGKNIGAREVTYRMPGEDKERFFECFMAPLRGSAGQILGGVLRVREITERKRAEEQTRSAALYARSLIEAGLDPLAAISVAGKILDVNEATEQATGVPRESLIGSDSSAYFTEPDKAHAAYQEAFTKGAVRNYPLTIRHVSGKLTEVLYNASVYRNEKGEAAGVLAVARDITERNRAEQAEERARRDGLTGLYNHRAFYSMLKNEIVRAQRFKRPLSLLMLDIDHFKCANDTHGHQAGDAILKGLSDLLMKQARAVDRACRYGGEEFTVILPETDAAVALNVAERMRAEVERQPFDIDGGKTVAITISIGVATYPQQVDSLEALVKAADDALYTAKQEGRNRVCRSETEVAGDDSSA